MARKSKRPAKPIQQGEITLYESMLRTVGKIEPPRSGNVSPVSFCCSWPVPRTTA